MKQRRRVLTKKLALLCERLWFSLRGQPLTSSTIFLAGSGRSGTTWLADIIGTIPNIQQVFEPLSPVWDKEVRELANWDKRDPYLRSVYLKPFGSYPRWHGYLQKVLSGQVRNDWTDQKGIGILPSRFLVKEIRSNLMLGYIYENFQPSIIYIMRHPCAVISSRLIRPKPWFTDVNDILYQEELVEDYLRPWVKEIEQEKDLVGAHAVWWALENLVALNQLHKVPHLLITYESLVTDPEAALQVVFRFLQVTKKPDCLNELISKPSRTSRKNRDYESVVDRLSAWKRELSAEHQERILDWSYKLGIDIYDFEIFPRKNNA